MKRFLKSRLNRFVPNPLRHIIKQRLSARFVEPVATRFSVKAEPSSLICQVDDRWRFRVPIGCDTELGNLTQTPEGQSEFGSLTEAANKGGILFDIGAHSGLISAMFCAARPENVAVAFEPSPVLGKRLVAIQELNQVGARMRIEQIGIGAETTTIDMMLDPAGGFVQSQQFEHTMWAEPKSIQVRIETIPDAAARLDMVPQFIKIDIEGYEFEAIAGAIEFLSRHKPVLFLELHLNYLEQRNLSPKRLIAMVEQCGYALYTSGGRKLKGSEVYDSPLPIVHVIAR